MSITENVFPLLDTQSLLLFGGLMVSISIAIIGISIQYMRSGKAVCYAESLHRAAVVLFFANSVLLLLVYIRLVTESVESKFLIVGFLALIVGYILFFAFERFLVPELADFLISKIFVR